MPQYLYTAMNGAGKECKGKIEAASEDAAVMELRQKNIYVTSLRVAVKAEKRTKSEAAAAGSGFNMNLGPTVIKKKELTVVTRQLAILLGAGLPLIRSSHFFALP